LTVKFVLSFVVSTYPFSVSHMLKYDGQSSRELLIAPCPVDSKDVMDMDSTTRLLVDLVTVIHDTIVVT